MVPCSISATRVSCPEALITKMFDIEGSLCGARGRACAIRERMRQSQAALERQNGLRSVDGHQFLASERLARPRAWRTAPAGRWCAPRSDLTRGSAGTRRNCRDGTIGDPPQQADRPDVIENERQRLPAACSLTPIEPGVLANDARHARLHPFATEQGFQELVRASSRLGLAGPQGEPQRAPPLGADGLHRRLEIDPQRVLAFALANHARVRARRENGESIDRVWGAFGPFDQVLAAAVRP